MAWAGTSWCLALAVILPSHAVPSPLPSPIPSSPPLAAFPSPAHMFKRWPGESSRWSLQKGTLHLDGIYNLVYLQHYTSFLLQFYVYLKRLEFLFHVLLFSCSCFHQQERVWNDRKFLCFSHYFFLLSLCSFCMYVWLPGVPSSLHLIIDLLLQHSSCIAKKKKNF